MPKVRANAFETGGLLLRAERMPFDASIKAAITARFRAAKIASIFRDCRRNDHYRITYRSNGHAVNGYAVVPRKLDKPLPCIIWNRGGSGEYGQIDTAQVFGILGMFASWGYVVIATQYSGNDGSEGRDELGGADLDDVLVLRKVLARCAAADTSRIGMYGGSRGGMMTYLCLTRAKWIKAAVTTAGLADLRRQVVLRPEMRPLHRRMFGGRTEDLRKRSAVCWPEKFPKRTPLLMLHGTADWRVNALDSVDLSAGLLRHGVHHQLVLFKDDDHGLSANRREKWRLTREWFDTHLRS